MTKIDQHAYQLAQNWPFLWWKCTERVWIRHQHRHCISVCVCVKSNANPGSSCPIELLICVSAGCFGRLMSGQLSGQLACTQTSTLRHVAVNDCFISLRQRWVVTTWGLIVYVRVQTIGKGGLNSCGQKMDRGRYQI